MSQGAKGTIKAVAAAVLIRPAKSLIDGLFAVLHRLIRWARSRRELAFEIALVASATLLLLAVYVLRVLPLSEAASAPPSGISISWAGQQLRGFTETAYISAKHCPGRATVLLDLYSTWTGRPPAGYVPSELPGRVAFAVSGDPDLRPTDVSVWTVGNGSEMLRDLLNERSDDALPPSLPLRVVRSNPTVGLAYFAVSFHWNPIRTPNILVKINAGWVSERTGSASCWLPVPGLLGGDSSTAANDLIGHPEWNKNDLGLPLYNGGVLVNSWQPNPFHVEPSQSVPAPDQIDPATWDCGGAHFQGRNCQAEAVISQPGQEAGRARSLTLWSIIGGLLLAVLGGAMVAALRTVIVGEHRSQGSG
ncbi:MAG TPA: hypothetical protein VFP23_06845 [Solirubrobacterales bacterium]|nr:hypothetical protein [Solirubrobacterales bacterium]